MSDLHVPDDATAAPASGRSGELISILAPMYNEEQVIDLFFDRVDKVLQGLDVRIEFICVNDGSRDRTLEMLLDRAARDPRVIVVNFTRNFGKEAAMTAALDQANGHAVIPIDADLQDPPELIPQFIAKWREGYDVVYGIRGERNADTLGKRTTAGAFYELFNKLSDVKIPPNVGDYRLMDRKVVENIKLLHERNRFMKGIFAWVGGRSIGIPFVREARAAGSTKWNYWRLWNFAIEGITSFSATPLKVWSYLGLGVAVLGCAYAAFLIFRTVVGGVDVPGYASLMVAVLVLGGLQLLSLGFIGEYIGRLYMETKQRPAYLISEVVGGASLAELEQARPSATAAKASGPRGRA
ncbi:MAG: glycosyltransferase [Phenylobacterium sp.]|uniref:glycosyltransferase family 2 protein n=1 Tax=Phenylobacterium sp. TaxID=1871053 RepID=UPI0012009ED7|nr:glycosyltransferase family 2 protein [Phenylobacterium sp.]TAJ71612.1 MAG: glycosyltransferase [Phenylobacterium sp.]